MNDNREIEPPGPLPEPPHDLAERDLPLREFARPVWYRGHKVNRDPIFFNRAAGRFAPPAGQFGTLYLAEDEYCSFIEAFNQEIIDGGPLGPIVNAKGLSSAVFVLLPQLDRSGSLI